MIRGEDHSLFEDLLGVGFELHDYGLCFAWLNHPHSIKHAEASEWRECLQLQLLVHLASVLDQDFCGLSKRNGDFTEIKHLGVRDQSSLHRGRTRLQVEN